LQNFAITGLGRSGTMFLATVMNKSKVWTVEHEPTMAAAVRAFRIRHPLIMDARHVQPRFNREHYGEVNSYLRHVLLDLDVARRGVIIRNPYDILVSVANWKSLNALNNELLYTFALGFRDLHRAVEAGAQLIRFERMTTDAGYLQQTLVDFGITDVRVTPDNLQTKINTAASYRFKAYRDLPVRMRRFYEHGVRWFVERYYH